MSVDVGGQARPRRQAGSVDVGGGGRFRDRGPCRTPGPRNWESRTPSGTGNGAMAWASTSSLGLGISRCSALGTCADDRGELRPLGLQGEARHRGGGRGRALGFEGRGIGARRRVPEIRLRPDEDVSGVHAGKLHPLQPVGVSRLRPSPTPALARRPPATGDDDERGSEESACVFSFPELAAPTDSERLGEKHRLDACRSLRQRSAATADPAPWRGRPAIWRARQRRVPDSRCRGRIPPVIPDLDERLDELEEEMVGRHVAERGRRRRGRDLARPRGNRALRMRIAAPRGGISGRR